MASDLIAVCIQTICTAKQQTAGVFFNSGQDISATCAVNLLIYSRL